MLSNLARETHLDIIARLPYNAKASLRSTNRYFYSIILPFSHDDLLVAEGEEYAAVRDLLACKYYLHSHHKSEFGENMTKKKKARGGIDSHNRFCVRCGLHPPQGCTGYSYGQCLQWGGQAFAVIFCVWCRKIELAEDDETPRECRHCRKRRANIRTKQEEQEKRVRRKAAREAWHRQRVHIERMQM